MSKTLIITVALLLAVLVMQSEARPGHRGRHPRPHRGHKDGPHKLMCKEETADGRVLFDEPCDFPELMECVRKPNHLRKLNRKMDNHIEIEEETEEGNEEVTESRRDRRHSGREEDEVRGRRRGGRRAERRRDRMAETEEEETIKYYCLPKTCVIEEEGSCPEESQCLAPRRYGARDTRPARCEIPCDYKLFLKSCLVNDENGDLVKESECRREGATCSQDKSEVIEVNGETMTAYFCSKEDNEENEEEVESLDNVEIEKDDEEEEFDIRARLCERRPWKKQRRPGQGRRNRRGQRYD